MNREWEDPYDMEFVELYDVIYNDFQDVNYDYNVVQKKISLESSARIAVLGSGVGKVCKKIKEKNKDVVGVDISENMLKKAQLNSPNIKYIHGDLRDENLFPVGSLDLVWIDERTLYAHPITEKEKIIQNSYKWLHAKGHLVVSLYHPEKLQVAARYYSSNYIDTEGNVHGFTYLNNFSHDCYYIPQHRDNHLFYYYDKITLDSGKSRIRCSSYHIEPIEQIYDLFLNQGWEVVHIEPTHLQIVGGYDLTIMKKRDLATTVDQIENQRMA
jgi:ubiquinone/menaquinone biosynthesis C-methylase UbiE